MLGGVSLFGGSGSVVRATVGVLILALLTNMMNLIGAPIESQLIAEGVLFIAFVALDGFGAEATVVSPRSIATRILSSNRGTVLLVVLVVVFWQTTPHFLGRNNIDNVLIQSALTGTIAIAMAVAFIGGQFDLSVGSVLALAGFVSVHAAGAGTGVAFAAAIATGAACGLVNGIIVLCSGQCVHRDAGHKSR